MPKKLQPPRTEYLGKIAGLAIYLVDGAKIRNEIYAEQEGDLEAIEYALKPFEPRPDAPVNETQL